MKNHNKKIHFMGIAGSGMSAAAMIASEKGYQVSGCDLNTDTAYSKELLNSSVRVSSGHNKSHIEDADIVAVTPAAFFQNKDNPEIVEAKNKNILITWQEFLGKYLHPGNKVICIAGTHGKSTTTGMAGLLFEEAGFDPSVIIGATVKEWKKNYRTGNGKYFITEADEFFNNFLNYSPDMIILNNIEFDHPDFFADEKEVLTSFKKFISNLKGDKTLIFNQDSEGIAELFSILDENDLDGVNLIGYTLSENPLIPCKNSFRAKNILLSEEKSVFEVENEELGINKTFEIILPGKFNISNSLGVIALSLISKIPVEKTKEVLSKFSGVGRRMEFIGEINGVYVYDDYGHHPTAIKATLEALRQKYPKNKIWAVVEPHTYSRTKALLPLYRNSFSDASEVIIAQIFKSRDSETFGINEESIVGVSGHDAIRFIDSFEKIVEEIKNNVKVGDVVIVMGAGLSYKLTPEIAKSI